MTLRERRILFYSLILVFLVLGTGVILYAQGLRLDPQTFQVTKVGGIYVRSFPAEADISLDGKLIRNKSGLFQSGTWINDLFPQTYALTLSAPHYRDLHFSLSVKPSLVTEIKYAVLVPDKGELVLPGPVRNFSFLGDQLILEDASGKLLFEKQTLSGTRVLGWTQDYLFLLAQGRNGTYYLNDLKNSTSTNLSAGLRRAGLRAEPVRVTLDPTSNSLILLQTQSGLSLYDFRNSSLTPVATSTPGNGPLTPSLSRFWLAWADFDPKSGASRVTLYDKVLGAKRVLPQLLAGRTLKFVWAENSTLGIIQNDGQAYVYTLGTGNLTQIARDAEDMAFSGNSQRVAVLEHNALEVFSLIDSDYWRFNPPEIGKVSGITWYADGYHLLLALPGRVNFLSLEDRGLENYDALADTDRFQYDPGANRFYYLKDGGIYRLDFPS